MIVSYITAAVHPDPEDGRRPCDGFVTGTQGVWGGEGAAGWTQDRFGSRVNTMAGARSEGYLCNDIMDLQLKI